MNGVSKITVSEDIMLVTFHQVPCQLGLIAEIFTSFAKEQINLDMVSQTAPQGQYIDLSFTMPAEELVRVLELVAKFREIHPGIKPMVSGGNCKIQLYGEEMREMRGVVAAAMAAVAKTDVELNLITTSEVDISLLVTRSHAEEAIKSLEGTFQTTAEIQ